MNYNGKCPIWLTPAWGKHRRNGDKEVYSPRAGGNYAITREAECNLGRCDDSIKARLTTWLVDQRRLGNTIPVITTNEVDEAESRKPLDVIKKPDRFLFLMKEKTTFLGEPIKFIGPYQDEIINGLREPGESDYYSKEFCMNPDGINSLASLAWTESCNLVEMHEIMKHLNDLNMVNFNHLTGIMACEYYVVSLNTNGHARIETVQSSKIESRQIFVAMWFGEEIKNVYKNCIEKSINDSGYISVRIDENIFNGKIDDEIISQIRRSRCVISDFTHGEDGSRGGVYYEAGFAHGLNLPVIFTCRADQIDKTHFDTRQFNHILWKEDELEEFRKALSNRISATLGDGPLKRQA